MGFKEAQNALNEARKKIEEAREEFWDAQEIPSDTPPFQDEFIALCQISDDIEVAQLSIDRRLAANGIDYRPPDRVDDLIEVGTMSSLRAYTDQWVKTDEPARIGVDKSRLPDDCIRLHVQTMGDTDDPFYAHRLMNEPESIWFAGDKFKLEVNITPSQSSQGEEIYASPQMAGKRPLALNDGLDRLAGQL